MKKIYLLLILLIVMFVGIVNVSSKEPFYNITGLFFRTDEATIGDRLYVDLYMLTKDKKTKIKGYFLNDNHSYVTLELKDIRTNNPYFEISN